MKAIAHCLIKMASLIVLLMATVSCGEVITEATFCAAGGAPPWCGAGRRSLEETIKETPAASFFRNPKDAALAEAAAQGDLDQMEALFSQGANANAKGVDDVDMLYWSYVWDSKSGFAKLLKFGADPLRDPPRRKAIAFEATDADDPGYLRILLEQGLDPNTTSTEGGIKTLLMQASSAGRLQQVDLLMKYCADLNWSDGQFGHNAALAAASLKKWGVVRRLLEAGYSYDLERLGWGVDADFQRISPKSFPVKHQNLLRVISMLEKRGVVFPLYDGSPAPPAAPRSAPVYAVECKKHPKHGTS